MNQLRTYGKWVLLAAVMLTAGFCYSCGTEFGRAGIMPVQIEAEAKTSELQGDKAQTSETPGANVQEPGRQEESFVGEPSTEAETTVSVPAYQVHVCGEVERPGVYRLEAGCRVQDAILAAGGFTQDAAEDYLNLAEMIQDGMKIMVPDRTAARESAQAGISMPSGGSVSPGGSAAVSGNSGKININTADRTALMTLSGIGEARADAILQYRDEHGRFSSIDEIMQVPGIKEAAFAKIKDKIEI